MVIIYKNNKSKNYLIHRLVAIHFIPNIKNEPYIDHVNNIKLDNTISNLRWCTNGQNQHNKPISCKNTSGIKGVSWCKKSKKWRVRICFNNNDIYLGLYSNIEDAKLARQMKAKELYGDFINTCEL